MRTVTEVSVRCSDFSIKLSVLDTRCESSVRFPMLLGKGWEMMLKEAFNLLSLEKIIQYTHFDEHGTVTMGRYQNSRDI